MIYQVIAKARVPIIKFVEKRSGISFDVRLENQKLYFSKCIFLN